MKKFLIFATALFVLDIVAMESNDYSCRLESGEQSMPMSDSERLSDIENNYSEDLVSDHDENLVSDETDGDAELSPIDHLDNLDDIAEQMVRSNQACQCGFNTFNKEVLKQHLSNCKEYKKAREFSLSVVNLPVDAFNVGNSNNNVIASTREVSLPGGSETGQAEDQAGRKRPRSLRAGRQAETQRNKKARLGEHADSARVLPTRKEKCACGKHFSTKKKLARHVKARHAIKIKNRTYYQCPKEGCTKKPEDRVALLLIHFASKHDFDYLQHWKPTYYDPASPTVKCLCGEYFDTNDQLTEHIKDTHVKKINNKKFYLCPKKGCPKKPDQRLATILAHIKVKHSTAKKENLAIYVKRKVPHKQCACGEPFDTGDLLADHVKSTHAIKIKKKTYYQCPVEKCAKNPKSDLLLLLDHFASKHTKEQVSYECKQCSDEFKSYSLLKKHERGHNKQSEAVDETNNAPAICSPRIAGYKNCACGKKFGDPTRLALHIKKKHAERRGKKVFYLCPKKGCKKQATLSLPQLLYHFKVKHPEADAINSNSNVIKPIKKKTNSGLRSHATKKTAPKKRNITRNYVYKQCACNMTFQTSEQLIDHIKAIHCIKVRNRTTYVCSRCNFYETRDLGEYLKHMAGRHTKEQVAQQ